MDLVSYHLCKYSTTNTDLRLFNAAFSTLKDETILTGCLHKLDKVVIVLFKCFPKETVVLIHGSDSL